MAVIFLFSCCNAITAAVIKIKYSDEHPSSMVIPFLNKKMAKNINLLRYPPGSRRSGLALDYLDYTPDCIIQLL